MSYDMFTQSRNLSIEKFNIKIPIWKSLKMLHTLQQQIFSQDLIIYVKINEHTYLISVQICLCFCNKW